MILCDGVHVDPETGKRTYLGHFQSRKAKEFPFVMPRIVVALSLTECQPTTQLRIEVVTSDDGEVIFKVAGRWEVSKCSMNWTLRYISSKFHLIDPVTIV